MIEQIAALKLGYLLLAFSLAITGGCVLIGNRPDEHIKGVGVGMLLSALCVTFAYLLVTSIF